MESIKSELFEKFKMHEISNSEHINGGLSTASVNGTVICHDTQTMAVSSSVRVDSTISVSDDDLCTTWVCFQAPGRNVALTFTPDVPGISPIVISRDGTLPGKF